MILSHSGDEFVLKIEEDELYTHFYGFGKDETNSLKRIFIEEIGGLVDLAIDNYKYELSQKEKLNKSDLNPEITMDTLVGLFENAIKAGHSYIGVKIQTEGSPEPEIIINHRNNFEKKLDYYKNAYNEDLTLKTFSGIKIVDAYIGYSASGVADALTFR